MFKTNWFVTVLVLIPLILLASLGALVGKTMEKKYKKRQDAFESLQDFSQESISGIRVVKAFVREASELRDFKSDVTNLLEQQINKNNNTDLIDVKLL